MSKILLYGLVLSLISSCATYSKQQKEQIKNMKGPIQALKSPTSYMKFQMAKFKVKLKSCDSAKVKNDYYNDELGKIVKIEGQKFKSGPKNAFKGYQYRGHWFFKLYRTDFKFNKNCEGEIHSVIAIAQNSVNKYVTFCDNFEKCNTFLKDAKSRIKDFYKIAGGFDVESLTPESLYDFDWNGVL